MSSGYATDNSASEDLSDDMTKTQFKVKEMGFLLYTRATFLEEGVAEAKTQAPGDVCMICHDEYNRSTHGAVELVGHPNCVGHVFGLSCVRRWFRQENSCPMCRTVHIRHGRAPFPKGTTRLLRQQWRTLVENDQVPRGFDFTRIEDQSIWGFDEKWIPCRGTITEDIDLMWSEMWNLTDRQLRKYNQSGNSQALKHIRKDYPATPWMTTWSDEVYAVYASILTLIIAKHRRIREGSEPLVFDDPEDPESEPLPEFPDKLKDSYVHLMEDAFGSKLR